MMVKLTDINGQTVYVAHDALLIRAEKAEGLNADLFGKVSAANDRILQAEADNATLRQDAERYRWLRSPARTNQWAVSHRRADEGNDWYTVDAAEYLDTAIDAAMREGKG